MTIDMLLFTRISKLSANPYAGGGGTHKRSGYKTYHWNGRYTRLRRVARISGGIFGEENAVSRLLTNCLWLVSFSWAQQLTKPAANNSLPTKGCRSQRLDKLEWVNCLTRFSHSTCNCASLAQVRNAGEGDSLSSSILKCLIHSAQSSLVLRWEASPAVRKRPSFTYNGINKYNKNVFNSAFSCTALTYCNFWLQPPGPSPNSLTKRVKKAGMQDCKKAEPSTLLLVVQHWLTAIFCSSLQGPLPTVSQRESSKLACRTVKELRLSRSSKEVPCDKGLAQIGLKPIEVRLHLAWLSLSTYSRRSRLYSTVVVDFVILDNHKSI